MAIAYRSITTVASSSRTSIAFSAPSGLAAGDLLIAQFYVVGNPSFTSVPTGFTHLTSISPSGATYTYWKIAAGTETTMTFAWSGSTYCGGMVLAYSGVDTTTPFDVSPTVNEITSSTSMTATGLTTVTTNAKLVWTGLLVNTFSGSESPTSGFTWEYHTSNFLAVQDATQAVAGSTGNKTVTLATGTNATIALFALRPASGSAVHGDAAASISVSGAASGHRGAKTTATGSVTVTGAAAGHAGYKTTAAGSIAVTGAVSGHRGFHTSAAGTLTVTGVAAGHVDRHDAPAGTVTVTGSASGNVGKHQTAAGSVAVTGAAAGTVHKHQTAAGTIVVTGTASGTVHRSTSATSTVTITGAASGSVSTPGSSSATQTVTVIGHAAGSVTHHATAAGTITVTSHASGSVASGLTASALGQLSVTGIATGHVGHVASALGVILLAGLAAAASDADYRVTIVNARIPGYDANGSIPAISASGRIITPTATGGTL